MKVTIITQFAQHVGTYPQTLFLARSVALKTCTTLPAKPGIGPGDKGIYETGYTVCCFVDNNW